MRSCSEVMGPTSDDLNTNRSLRPEPKGLTGAGGATMVADLPALPAPAQGQTRSGVSAAACEQLHTGRSYPIRSEREVSNHLSAVSQV